MRGQRRFNAGDGDVLLRWCSVRIDTLLCLLFRIMDNASTLVGNEFVPSSLLQYIFCDLPVSSCRSMLGVRVFAVTVNCSHVYAGDLIEHRLL